MEVNIGFLQFQPVLGDGKANAKQIIELTKDLDAVDLLVLPELANSGYNFLNYEQAFACAEEVAQSEFIGAMENLCRAKKMWMVTGFCEKEQNVLYNSAVFIGPDGVKGLYRKVHLFLNEPDFFAPGNLGFPVFDMGDVKIGMLVCFDWVFPEAWRVLALKAADIICHPSNLVLPYCQQAVPVHALCNRVYVVTANRTGTEGSITFTGQSIIAAPNGSVMKKATIGQSEIGLARVDIHLARSKNITARNHLFGSRRPALYEGLTELGLH
jgi:predicted amidohydrolase